MTLSHILHEEYAFSVGFVLLILCNAFIWWKAPEGFSKKKSQKVATVIFLLSSSIFGYRALSLNHISQDELETWISEYDPFFKPEDEQPDSFSPYRRYGEFGKAVSTHRRGGGTAPITAALAGAQGAEAPSSRALATFASIGLFTPDAAELDEIARKIQREHQAVIDEMGVSPVPHWDPAQLKHEVLHLIDSELLTEQVRARLIVGFVANIRWEANRQAPEIWLKKTNKISQIDEAFTFSSVRHSVEALIALEATEELKDVEEDVLSALKAVYRSHDASFNLDNRLQSHPKRVIASLYSADDALFLMEHYGVPDFVDLPGFHKYLDKERTGFSPQHPEQYLAAALMFRLEQLHLEL